MPQAPASLLTPFYAPYDFWPRRMPSPFCPNPDTLAQGAAQQLMSRLDGRDLGAPEAHEALWAPGGGKMFGVLVVTDRRGQMGWLAGFSGMWGEWVVEGFVPPLFDPTVMEAFWPAGQRELAGYTAQIDALDHNPAWQEVQAQREVFDAELAKVKADLREAQRARKARRKAERARILAELPGSAQGPALAALDQESRRDKAARKELSRQHAEGLAALDEARARLLEARAEVVSLRERRSQALQRQIHDAYIIRNARGERRALVDLFAPAAPPAGAGDCAGPKLLGYAHAHGLQPVAMAEFWWGAPPRGGGRHSGQLYPACRGKCGPILPFMLEGLEVEPPPVYGAHAPSALPIVFEDPWLVVVDKPSGLLSVPGRGASMRDSVQHRLRQAHPALAVAHRLDLDTSGLLVAAKDVETLASVQRQFARRQAKKVYLAWLDGEVAEEGGRVELPLRGDLDDRPRQIVDLAGGKPAVTEWRVARREGGRTLVELRPLTGRTHQLRVHAAHPEGVGHPIVGDRLYGRADERLMLHAARLEITHPQTGRVMVFEAEAPF